MFSGCSNLKHLDLSNFNTNEVLDMSEMFSGCSNLIYLDITEFNMSKIIISEDNILNNVIIYNTLIYIMFKNFQ